MISLVVIHLMWFCSMHDFVAVALTTGLPSATIVERPQWNCMSCWIIFWNVLLSGRRWSSCDGADKWMRPQNTWRTLNIMHL
jgi:hypothetical protein